MLQVALAQFRPRKAAYRDNLARLGALLSEAASWPVPPQLVVCSETALTGYFLEGGVGEVARPAQQLFEDLRAIHASSGAPPLDIAIGFYERADDRLYNSALWATLGGADAGIRHVHRKVFLPTYGVFDEERFVEAGRSIAAFDTGVGRAAMLVCEDAWHSLSPTIAALGGAQLIVVHAASPARGLQPGFAEQPSSMERWERLARDMAAEHGCFAIVAQLVGFEGGKNFPGGSLVVGPRGDLIARAPLFEDALLPVALDPADIARARTEMPLLADLEMRLPHLLRSLPGGDEAAANRVPPLAGAPRASGAAPRPAAMARPPRVDADPLAIDPALARRWLVEFIRDELVRRRGFQKAVLGLSGGVDSALVAFLAAEALGPANVLGVRMPYRTSSRESLDHAQLVIDALGIRAATVDISSGVDGIATSVGERPDAARLGNIMARMRMITLFDLSAAEGSLPLGTGNKTERLFGYFTWHADDSPPVNPIGDLFKTQVWALARHVGVPAVIVEKPATADLIHNQTDEGDLGISYPRADLILHWLLSGYRPEEVQAMGFTPGEVALVRRRLDGTHWKRRLPTVAMVSQTAIGEYYLRPVDY